MRSLLQSLPSHLNGNIYITGTTNGSLSGIPKIGSYENFFISKFDSEGNLLWTRLMGSTVLSSVYAGSIHVDRFGDIIMSGSGGGDINGQSPNGDGYVLVKLNPEGNLLWTRIYPTLSETLGAGITSDGTRQWIRLSGVASASTEAMAVSWDGMGNVYTAGYTTGNLDGQIKSGTEVQMLSKYNLAGVKL